MSYAPERGVCFEVELKSSVKVGGIEMGMESIASVVI